MKLIIGIIKPLKLNEVMSSLRELGVGDISVTEVKGFGRQKGIKEHYHGAEYAVDFLDKVQIEFLASNEVQDKAAATVQRAAYSGSIGDGKIFIYEVN